ncbi:MarR family winged helix-turn-helix transcriptional regulator [Streptacidiphilus monticola]|uniref:MarR family winged helix-turn-helix transcriptional regulator n=1 Tax=Streptacidiphilus monticola TaxID=2161674 RepID=A0ABW1GAB8_9ACTN
MTPPAAAPEPERLAADLRTAVGELVRAGRPFDQLAPIPATVLDLLDRQGPMTTAELAASRGVRHQTMAATVRELTESGLLTAEPHPADARKKTLTLTPEGRRAIEADRRQRIGLLARALTENLDEAEQRLLARALPLLGRVSAALSAGDAARGAVSDRGPISGAW